MQAYEDYDLASVPIGRRFHNRYENSPTDAGGAYRWDAETKRLEQMVLSTNTSHYSVAGIALQSTNRDIVDRHVSTSTIAFSCCISIQQAEQTLESTA